VRSYISERQVLDIEEVALRNDMSIEEVNEFAHEMFGCGIMALTRGEARILLEALNGQSDSRER